MKSRLLAALFTLFAANASHADVLSNGNFEQGSTGWTITGNAGVAGQYGAGFYWGGGSVAQNGAYAIAFNGGDSYPNGQVSQSFATTVGQAYTLSFDYGASSAWAQSLNWGVYGNNSFVALAGGLVTDINPFPLLNTYTYDFVANSSATTLRFSDFFLNSTYSNDGLLDNVSVTAKGAGAAVPEPASLALLGLGILGLGVARRRKSA